VVFASSAVQAARDHALLVAIGDAAAFVRSAFS